MKQKKHIGNKAFKRNIAHWRRIDEKRQEKLSQNRLEKFIASTLLCTTLLSGCTYSAAQPAQDTENSITVNASVDVCYPEKQYGTLIDENGEVWYFEDIKLDKNNSYAITYADEWELISLSENGKIIQLY